MLKTICSDICDENNITYLLSHMLKFPAIDKRWECKVCCVRDIIYKLLYMIKVDMNNDYV